MNVEKTWSEDWSEGWAEHEHDGDNNNLSTATTATTAITNSATGFNPVLTIQQTGKTVKRRCVRVFANLITNRNRTVITTYDGIFLAPTSLVNDSGILSSVHVSPLPPHICDMYNAYYNGTSVAPYYPEIKQQQQQQKDDGDIYMEINDWITIIVPALCLILGTFGNIMSILVVSRLGNTLKSSSAAYLKYLAFFDLLGIWASLPRYLSRSLFDYDYRHYSPLLCKTQRFCVYFALDVAAWITVAVTADRLIAVRFPYHAAKWCTERVSRFVLLATCIAFLFLDGHVFWTYGYKKIIKNGEIIEMNCVHPDDMSEFIWTYVQPILATLTYAVGPFAFLLLANIIIAQRLIKQSKFLKRCSTKQTSGGKAEADRTVYTMSFMLVATSVVFLVMNTPSFFYMVIMEILVGDIKMSQKDKAIHRLLKTCFNMSMYINHSVNFFIYCLSAKKFRTVFWQVLTCTKEGSSDIGQQINKHRQSVATKTAIKTIANYSNSDINRVVTSGIIDSSGKRLVDTGTSTEEMEEQVEHLPSEKEKQPMEKTKLGGLKYFRHALSSATGFLSKNDVRQSQSADDVVKNGEIFKNFKNSKQKLVVYKGMLATATLIDDEESSTTSPVKSLNPARLSVSRSRSDHSDRKSSKAETLVMLNKHLNESESSKFDVQNFDEEMIGKKSQSFLSSWKELGSKRKRGELIIQSAVFADNFDKDDNMKVKKDGTEVLQSTSCQGFIVLGNSETTV